MTQAEDKGRARHRYWTFVPILAGATLRDRLIACVGAPIGIGLTVLACTSIIGHGAHFPLIVAPIGASAVLLFAIPASPMAQPWPIIGGNTISALVGVAVARLIGDETLAVAVGVSLAIAAMSLARCLHPPGGAAAMTAILGGPAVAASGFMFPFTPVALNSLILVGLGIAFHRLSRRAYPHVPVHEEVNRHGTVDPSPIARVGFREEDVDAALADLHEAFDIDREDIKRLLRQVELQALVRTQGDLTCEDIMSRDVVKVRLGERAETARSLLLAHNIRTLPVVDEANRIAGTVGLRELAATTERVEERMSMAVTAERMAPATSLVPVLSNGRTHAVIVTDRDGHIDGLITQSDLLGALARVLTERAFLSGPKPAAAVSQSDETAA